MSSFTCLHCRWTNRYEHDSPFKKLWEVFEDIWYCYDCASKHGITEDVRNYPITEKE